MSFLPPAAGRVSFPKEEEEVLRLWKELDAFRSSLELSAGKPEVSGSQPSSLLIRRNAMCGRDIRSGLFIW